MNEEPVIETLEIENRSDFAQWAIERARAIVTEQSCNLALAAREMPEDRIADAGNSLGQAMMDALLEVFDGLLPDA